jgi:flagellar biosynthesis GTPase FlhF
MRRHLLFIAALGFVSVASAVEVGQTWAEVEAELGKPISKLAAGGRNIGRWGDIEVIFVDGRVASFVRRDLAAEAASAARRKQEADAVRQQREELDAEARRAEAERIERDERERPERERQALANRIAALEAQLEVERQKLKAMSEQVADQHELERKARMVTLRKELATLRAEIQRALADGETQRAARLHSELLAKERELSLLARPNR